MKSKHSFLFYFKIAKELSEFRNYLCLTFEIQKVCVSMQKKMAQACMRRTDKDLCLYIIHQIMYIYRK